MPQTKKTAKDYLHLAGEQNNRLTLIEYEKTLPDRTKIFKFLCSCGSTTFGQLRHFRNGKKKSCGVCIYVGRKARFRHGMRNTKIYRAWKAMRQRCSNKNNQFYYRYGGRGIKVCKRWSIFENFFSDMGLPPSVKHSLDRIDYNQDYKPGNCRWATIKEQAVNSSNSVFLSYDSLKLCTSDWARLTGIDRRKIAWRLKKNWPLEEVLGLKNHNNVKAGPKKKFNDAIKAQIVAIAYELPPVGFRHWTRVAIGKEAVARGIVDSISPPSLKKLFDDAGFKFKKNRFFRLIVKK